MKMESMMFFGHMYDKVNKLNNSMDSFNYNTNLDIGI